MKRPLVKDPLAQLLLGSLLFGFALILVLLTQLEGWRSFWTTATLWSLHLEKGYRQWFNTQVLGHSLLLLPLAYLGGLMASLSPCILSLLPINLSYIGTREIHSRREALVKSTSFVLGVVTVLSLLGLFSSLASLVMVAYKGYIYSAIGLLIITMGLNLLGVIQLSLPQLRPRQAIASSHPLLSKFPTAITGPYSVGLTFALLSSPCSSPILFGFLAAAAATGSQVISCLAMVCYAIGYTTVIFISSLFTGFAKQSKELLPYAQIIVQGSSLVLIVLGGYYLLSGLSWMRDVWKLGVS